MLRQLLQRFAAWLILATHKDEDATHELIVNELDDEGADYVHVMPINDLVEHEWDDDGNCPCGPEVQPVERDDGSIGWIYIHSALDGRDLEEGGQGVPMENPHGLLDEFDGLE
ncbi:hypothetical protein [uncultured Corynebacterium sp.]|uniref:hypothetical protein n=1 Tax=uncultured Corynebacterium sp. TaxID=159447 RepID=UPI0025955B63|nr:hypothetical protein [uncultured Corynebacterium sp.]